MRNLIVVLVISSVLTSCFSYSNLDAKHPVTKGHTYRFTSGKTITKGTVTDLDGDRVTLQFRGQKKQILLSEQEKIKVRRFSTAKTVCAVVPVAVLTTAVIALQNMSIDMGSIQSPP